MTSTGEKLRGHFIALPRSAGSVRRYLPLGKKNKKILETIRKKI